ncbi:MAG: transposase, partial [Candidatus Lokiarchaeia archaeon]
INKISPSSFERTGVKSLLSNQYMLAFFKKFCDAIVSRTWKFKRAKNARYEDQDFLKVFFFSEIIGRSIHDTSERLNEYLLSSKRGRRKSFADGRRKRIIPHQTEVNKYLRKIGLNKARSILRICLDSQLTEALRLGLISKKVNVIIDFTEHPYYGQREDKMIKGTNRQKGTKKMRHYLGFSILSKKVHLYAGLEHVANGQSKIPIILEFLDHVLDLGFELNYVLMDREFYRAVLLHEIKARKGNVLIPTKQYKKVREMIEAYIKGEGNRVRRYTFSSATEAKHRFFQHVYLIIKAKRSFTLQGVKRDYRTGKISLDDARKRIFAIMTTEKPKGKTSSWASRTSLFYRRRWLIETGFSDLNRINRRWKSNHDNVRYLDMLARLLLYNSWKINKKLIKNARTRDGKQREWTLVQNQDSLKQLFLTAKKKSLEVIG